MYVNLCESVTKKSGTTQKRVYDKDNRDDTEKGLRQKKAGQHRKGSTTKKSGTTQKNVQLPLRKKKFRIAIAKVLYTDIFASWLGFVSLIRYIHSDKETIITTIQDLDLLFQIYRLADKVVEFKFSPYFGMSLLSIFPEALKYKTFRGSNWSHNVMLP